MSNIELTDLWYEGQFLDVASQYLRLKRVSRKR